VNRAAGVILALGAAALLAAACGRTVDVEALGATGSGGSLADAGAPDDAAADAAPDAVLVSEAGLAACDDPATCSRLIAYDGTCLGAASAGTYCDYLGTECSPTPPDCAAIAKALGLPVALGDCGGGLSLCQTNFGGDLTPAYAAALCAARAALGVPVDCQLD
jgi:hypothetical protein